MALETSERDAARRADALSRVIEAISGELELGPLLTRVVACATELLDAGYGSIGLVEERPDGPVIRIAAVHNMPPDELGACIPPGAGLAGQVLRDQRPICVARYGDLERPLLPTLAGHTVIGLPIWWQARMIGFFGIGAAPPRRFEARDVELLAVFARHAAIAIENARLFEAERQRSARLSIIQRISSQIASSLSLDVIFQTAVEAIHSQLHYAYVAAGIVDTDDPETLRLLAQAGAPGLRVPDDYCQSIHVGLVGEAARTRRRVLVNDVTADPRYLAILRPTIRAELVVPLAIGERLLGVLNIESEEPIGAAQVEEIELIAGQLSVAMDQAGLFARTQRALAEARLLYETSQRISNAMSVDAVVTAYLDQVAQRGRYTCSVVLYTHDAAGQRAGVIVRGFWSPQGGASLANTRLPYTRDALDPPLDAGETVTIRDVHTDPRVSPELRAMQARDGRPALALIPLMVGTHRLGLVVLSAPQVHDWSEAELQPYQVTAAQLAAAIDSRQQHLRLAEQSQQLAILEERRRLARELHDSVTQSLFGMSLLAQVLPELWQRDPDEARASLEQIRHLTRNALSEMRALLFELRPADLGSQGLARALRDHAAVFGQRTGVQVTVEQAGEIALPPTVEQALFRVAQEALANVTRHAQARQVRVRLEAGPPFELTIADDGRGFAPDHVAKGRLGLVSMRERLTAIGAELEIRSASGKGTVVAVAWPARGTG
jgi:signal transduction histidine kinase